MRLKLNPNNDWQILRNRYPSKRAYLRRIALSPVRYEEYANWLVDQGADVYAKTAENEILRFNLNGVLGIWYGNCAWNLLMHDLAEKFKNDSIKI